MIINKTNNVSVSALGVRGDNAEFRQGTFNTKRKDSATAEVFAIIDIYNNFFNTNLIWQK